MRGTGRSSSAEEAAKAMMAHTACSVRVGKSSRVSWMLASSAKLERIVRRVTLCPLPQALLRRSSHLVRYILRNSPLFFRSLRWPPSPINVYETTHGLVLDAYHRVEKSFRMLKRLLFLTCPPQCATRSSAPKSKTRLSPIKAAVSNAEQPELEVKAEWRFNSLNLDLHGKCWESFSGLYPA